MPTSAHPFDFSKFFPGMEFFSGGLAGKAPVWPVPTVNVQELEKRVGELKTVLFWLEQNAAALKATIQALEVQKMTLSTLQSMNVSAADLARAFTLPPAPAPAPAPAAEAKKPAPAAEKPATPDPLMWWNALNQQFQQMAAASAAATAQAARSMSQAATPAAAPAAEVKKPAAAAEKPGAAAKPAAKPAAKAAPKAASRAAPAAARKKAG